MIPVNCCLTLAPQYPLMHVICAEEAPETACDAGEEITEGASDRWLVDD